MRVASASSATARHRCATERRWRRVSIRIYAVGRKPVTLTLCRFPPLDPYNAVLLLLAVLGRLEHPTIPNKDALAVIQSNR
jgi:hypothetical protein